MRPVIAISGFSLQRQSDYSLLLRRWQIQDAPAVFKEVDRNRSHLEQWLPWVQETRGIEDSVNFVQGSVAAFENGSKYEYGIFLRPIDDKTKCLVIGTVGILGGSTEGTLEIGYWLAKYMQGNGIVTMAVKTLVEEARKFLGISHFVIKSHVDNWKSRKIPERLGFVKKQVFESKPALDGLPSKMIEYHLE